MSSLPASRSQSTASTGWLLRRFALGLIFGVLVLVAVSLFGDLRQVSTQVLAFRWSLFPVVLLLTLFNYTLRFLKWHFYLSQIGAEHLGWLESARLFVAGFPLAVTPGKAGEVLKGIWLQQAAGVPVARGVAVVVAERVSDGLAVLLLSTIGVIAYPQYWPAFAAILAVLLSVVIVSQVRPLALGLISLSARLPVIKRFTPAVREFYEGSFAVFRPKATLLAVMLGMISWLGEGAGMYLILIGLGVSPGMHTLVVAVFTLSFSIVIGAASTLPGGLGASEASIAGMLTLLLGLAAPQSAAATLLIRFATLWFGISLGLLVWMFSPRLLGFGSHLEKPA